MLITTDNLGRHRLNQAPESWLDLAALKVLTNKRAEALATLKTALDLNARRLATQPNASNILKVVATDPRLAPLRERPEFQQMISTNK